MESLTLQSPCSPAPFTASEGMLQGLILQQRASLMTFFDELALTQVHATFQLLLECKGTLQLCGVGKSGIIAQKLAATMKSTGAKASYLDACHAMHGDLGGVHAGDVVLLLSKSGESEELLTLAPHLRKRGATLIALTSSPSSRLNKLCDHTLHLPVDQELCPYNLAPTTSTAAQLIIGDILAIALMRARGLTLQGYGSNHPAGRIGRRIALHARDMMITGKHLPLCKPGDLLKDILFELSSKGCGAILIVEKDKLLGIFTDGDLRRALQQEPQALMMTPMKALMTLKPRSIEAHALAYEALNKMESPTHNKVTVLPVVEGESLVGLIKLHDLVQLGLC